MNATQTKSSSLTASQSRMLGMLRAEGVTANSPESANTIRVMLRRADTGRVVADLHVLETTFGVVGRTADGRWFAAPELP